MRSIIVRAAACCALLTACGDADGPGRATTGRAAPAEAAARAPAPSAATSPALTLGSLPARAPATATPPVRPAVASTPAAPAATAAPAAAAVPAAASAKPPATMAATSTSAAAAMPAAVATPAAATAPATPTVSGAARVRATKGETCSRYVRYCVDWCATNMSGSSGCLDACRARGESCLATGEWTVEENVKILTHMAPR